MDQEQINQLVAAIQKGDLDYIRALPDDNLDWLTQPLLSITQENLFAIQYAALYGQMQIIEWLLEKKPDLIDLQDNSNVMLFTYALQNHHYQVAAFLWKNQRKNNDSCQINFQDRLNMLLFEPNLISLFTADELYNVPNKLGMHFADNTLYWYKARGKRNSFFAQIDIKTGCSVRFDPVKTLGAGEYGCVRLFKNQKEEQVCVKSLKRPIRINTPAFDFERRMLINEKKFYQKAYPVDKKSMMFELIQPIAEKNYLYTNRQLMDFIPGSTLRNFLPTITCAYELLKVVYLITKELLRIHCLGIIHGDLHSANIMINKKDAEYMVNIIDFGFAYDVNANHIRTIDDSVRSKHIAPERYYDRQHDNAYLKPHVNQDVYAFGHLLESHIKKHAMFLSLKQSFPEIELETFIIQALQNEPDKRPRLSAYCDVMYDALYLASLKGTNEYEILPREIEFNQRIYPEGYNSNYLAWETSCMVFPKIKDVLKLVTMIDLIAQEIQRLHSVGIIHNDLRTTHIKIDIKSVIPQVLILDFRYAADCFVDKSASPLQDIFSLGSLLNKLLFSHNLSKEVFELFPAIRGFIQQSARTKKSAYLSLESFCSVLKEDIDEYKDNISKGFEFTTSFS